MFKKIIAMLVAVLISSQLCAWEPSQEPAKKVSLTYELFQPFGKTDIVVSVDEEGFIERLSIATELMSFELASQDLKQFRYPSLADIEVMHYGKATEDGLGGNFSLCIPYGDINRVKGENYWQRAVLAVFVAQEKYQVTNIPLPVGNMKYGEANDCEISALEVYGF